jgi:hypothetical protein
MYDDAIHLFMSGNVPVGEEYTTDAMGGSNGDLASQDRNIVRHANLPFLTTRL